MLGDSIGLYDSRYLNSMPSGGNRSSTSSKSDAWHVHPECLAAHFKDSTLKP